MGLGKLCYKVIAYNSTVQVISASVRRPGQRPSRAALISLVIIKANICDVIVHDHMILAVI